MKKVLYIILFLQFNNGICQVILNADGPGNTYELISSVLAPGFDAVEEPDCNHLAFGRHIDEVFDTQLNTHVFRFQIHTTPDNDRCIKFDRQRNEIKTYETSPDNLKGIEGETVVYKWKFKLDVGFQSSTKFTHIHQLKSVGGLYEDMPMYTLTTRKGTPDKLELRYAQTNVQATLKQTDLTPFKGVWVDVTETIKYGNNSSSVSGNYSIIIKRVSDNSELFSYSNNAIKNWQTNADFVRPKWGIYRSLDDVSSLRDESVLFANFSIEETPTLSLKELQQSAPLITIYPNPTKTQFHIKEKVPNSFNSIKIIDNLGRIISSQKNLSYPIDISNLNKGLYFIELKKDTKTISIEKLIVN